MVLMTFGRGNVELILAVIVDGIPKDTLDHYQSDQLHVLRRKKTRL